MTRKMRDIPRPMEHRWKRQVEPGVRRYHTGYQPQLTGGLFSKPHRNHGEKSTLNTVHTERTRSPLPRIHQSATCLCWPVTRRTTAAVHLDTFFQKKTFKDARSSAVNFKVIYRVCYLDLPVSYLWTVLFVFTPFSSGYEGDVRTSSWVNTGQEDAPLPPPHQI